MSTAVLALTPGACRLAQKIQQKVPGAVVFTGESAMFPGAKLIRGRFSTFIGIIFTEYDTLIFIMAAGIVVRSIAPYLKDKTCDPAVLVADEKGRYVISLLSGHLGGANSQALKIANLIGADPVITTASDLNQILAVDTMAMRLGCSISSMKRAKEITALLIRGKKVEFVSDYEVKLPAYLESAPGLPVREISGQELKTAARIIHSNKKRKKSAGSVQLIPANIVIGIGCRKGVKKETIISLVKKYLKELSLSKKAVKKIATIDLKSKEKGIMKTALYFECPLEIIQRSEIAKVEEMFGRSDFVKKTTGVSAVAEPASFLASDRSGKLILEKQKGRGVTIAFWEEKSNGDLTI